MHNKLPEHEQWGVTVVTCWRSMVVLQTSPLRGSSRVWKWHNPSTRCTVWPLRPRQTMNIFDNFYGDIGPFWRCGRSDVTLGRTSSTWTTRPNNLKSYAPNIALTWRRWPRLFASSMNWDAIFFWKTPGARSFGNNWNYSLFFVFLVWSWSAALCATSASEDMMAISWRRTPAGAAISRWC